MSPNALHAAEACHQLVHSFLISSSDDFLHSISIDLKKCNNEHNIINLHKTLDLPTFYPPSFDKQLHKKTQNKVLASYKSFLKILDHWDLEQLSISYNGGKDCLVQLIIYLAAVYQHTIIDKKKINTKNTNNVNSGNKQTNILHINAVYVHTESEFEGQIKFLEQSVLQYGLDFTAVYTNFNPTTSNSSQVLRKEDSNIGKKYNDNYNDQYLPLGKITNLFSPIPTLPGGFLTYLNYNTLIKAIIVGIRHTDPYGSTLKLEQKTDTDRGWPDFMRINPILNWHTSEIWYFIKWLQLKSYDSDFVITYCSLYDDGYTSLGGCDSTVRNPRLKRNDSSFWPAWWILDDDIERLSRVQKGKV